MACPVCCAVHNNSAFFGQGTPFSCLLERSSQVDCQITTPTTQKPAARRVLNLHFVGSFNPRPPLVSGGTEFNSLFGASLLPTFGDFIQYFPSTLAVENIPPSLAFGSRFQTATVSAPSPRRSRRASISRG